jgi:hypothetical protein
MITNEQAVSALTEYFEETFHPNRTNMSLVDGMKRALEAYEKSKWISVEDSLPDEEVSVLVKDKWGNVSIDEIRPLGEAIWYYDGEHKSITHWQLLPQY